MRYLPLPLLRTDIIIWGWDLEDVFDVEDTFWSPWPWAQSQVLGLDLEAFKSWKCLQTLKKKLGDLYFFLKNTCALCF